MVERFKLLLGEAIEDQEAELYLDMAKLIILARRFPFEEGSAAWLRDLSCCWVKQLKIRKLNCI
jgi:hypothetical protein